MMGQFNKMCELVVDPVVKSCIQNKSCATSWFPVHFPSPPPLYHLFPSFLLLFIFFAMHARRWRKRKRTTTMTQTTEHLRVSEDSDHRRCPRGQEFAAYYVKRRPPLIREKSQRREQQGSPLRPPLLPWSLYCISAARATILLTRWP